MELVIFGGILAGLFLTGVSCGWHGRGLYERERRGGMLK